MKATNEKSSNFSQSLKQAGINKRDFYRIVIFKIMLEYNKRQSSFVNSDNLYGITFKLISLEFLLESSTWSTSWGSLVQEITSGVEATSTSLEASLCALIFAEPLSFFGFLSSEVGESLFDVLLAFFTLS